MIMPILAVNDVNASVSFYTDKLNFHLMMSMPTAPDGSGTFAIVQLGQAHFGLGYDDRTPKGIPFAPGVQFMVYLPDGQDIDAFYADVKAKGVKIDDELTDTYWGDRAFSIHDPNGYWLTFAVTVRQVPVDEMAAALRERDQQ